jgi:hypothetical protein
MRREMECFSEYSEASILIIASFESKRTSDKVLVSRVFPVPTSGTRQSRDGGTKGEGLTRRTNEEERRDGPILVRKTRSREPDGVRNSLDGLRLSHDVFGEGLLEPEELLLLRRAKVGDGDTTPVGDDGLNCFGCREFVRQDRGVKRKGTYE